LMKSVVPAPDVDFKVSDEPAAVPPTSIGFVIWVVKVGLVARTSAPVPVSSVTAVAKFADDGVARKVATPAPRPAIPVETGRPVPLVSVTADGVPRFGVVRVGEVPNTKAPVPVSSVTAEMRLAEDGVPRKVATPVPRPETPVLIGRPVPLVKVTADGVPRFGVTKVGDVPNTSAPVPVSSEMMFASFADVLIEEVAKRPRVEVDVQVGTPPKTASTWPVDPIARFPRVLAPVA
jgi:hypothetical protein